MIAGDTMWTHIVGHLNLISKDGVMATSGIILGD